MFDEEVHKNALKEFIAFLRTMTTQKNIAFFSDVSREYVRDLGKGEKIPTIKVFFSIIESAFTFYADGLTNLTLAADRSKGLDYVKKLKAKKGDAKRGA